MLGVRRVQEAAETAGRTVSGAMIVAAVALVVALVAVALAVRTS